MSFFVYNSRWGFKTNRPTTQIIHEAVMFQCIFFLWNIDFEECDRHPSKANS